MKKHYACLLGAAIGVATALSLPASASTDGYVEKAKAAAQGEFTTWAQNAAVITAIQAQNAEHAGLSEDDIAALDAQWRDEAAAGGGDLISSKLDNDLAAYLRSIKDGSDGLITEIFVMDNRGLNVGQTNKTGDYMQGDEAKWQQTYSQGPGAVHIGDVEPDGGLNISQVSLSITDPQTHSAIGAVTIGVNVDKLN